MRALYVASLLLVLGCSKGFKAAGVGSDGKLSEPPAGVPRLGPALMGVNLSGAEFGNAMPGQFGTDYTYPTTTELDYFKSKGLYLVRLPLRWERVQHALNGPLDSLEIARIRAFVREAASRGIGVILDIHNFAYYNGFVIGAPEVPTATFKDLWQKLAGEFKDEPGVYAYGLMNEPHDTAGKWAAAAQAGMDGVRLSDKLKKVFVPGDGWSAAHTWRTVNEALDVKDPSNNFAYEAHVYFDADNSGTYTKDYDGEGATPTTGVDRLKPFVEWLKEKGHKGFIGEYGIPNNDARWNVTLENALIYMRDNCLAGTYWSAGPWWGNYALSVEPAAGGSDKPQMEVLTKYPGNTACVY